MITPVLYVKDLEASLAFFSDKMGFNPIGESMPGPDGKPAFSAIRRADNEVWLQRIADRTEAALNFEMHVRLTAADDIQAIYDQIRGKGVNVYLPIKEEFWGEATFGVTDLDGFRWRFAKQVREMSVEAMMAASSKQ